MWVIKHRDKGYMAGYKRSNLGIYAEWSIDEKGAYRFKLRPNRIDYLDLGRIRDLEVINVRD